MDIQLPDMNGLELTTKIKAINSDVPIIAQTAFASQFDKEMCFNSGCDDYITKPITKNDILALIDSYFCEEVIS